jgi:recombination protein RecT
MSVATPSSNARSQVAQRASGQPEQQTLAQLIERQKPEIARVLPKHLDPDRLARIALTVLRKTPQLGNCTPESFLGALMTCAQLGLEPGVSNEAYLVPHRNKKTNTTECTLIIGYQGYAKLFWQHPLAKHLDAQAVYENDEFDYQYGLEPRLVHKPALGARGKVIAYYAVASLQGGGSAFIVMSPEDVRRIRGSAGPSGQIADPMQWMEKKTALRQLFKLMPKSSQLTSAITHDGGVRTDATAPIAEVSPDVINGELVDPMPPAGVDAATGEIDPADFADMLPDDPQAGA